MNDSVGDKAARILAASFYRGLGFGKSVRTAFDLGLNALKLRGLEGDEYAPVLLEREGADATQYTFVLGQDAPAPAEPPSDPAVASPLGRHSTFEARSTEPEAAPSLGHDPPGWARRDAGQMEGGPDHDVVHRVLPNMSPDEIGWVQYDASGHTSIRIDTSLDYRVVRLDMPNEAYHFPANLDNRREAILTKRRFLWVEVGPRDRGIVYVRGYIADNEFKYLVYSRAHSQPFTDRRWPNEHYLPMPDALHLHPSTDGPRWGVLLPVGGDFERCWNTPYQGVLGIHLSQIISVGSVYGVPDESWALSRPIADPGEPGPLKGEQSVAGADDFPSCFISHSLADKRFARRVHDALQDRGIRCWLDDKSLAPGDDLYAAIDEGVRQADRLLLVCSQNSLRDSWWVDAEVTMALEREQRLMGERGVKMLALVPVDLDGYLFRADLHGKGAIVRSRVVADFKGWEEDESKFEFGVERLV